ncbi:MAG: hypothetical protein Q8R00_04685 [Candidatus Nanoarchaeia archaeon]|nr:hypothetical protein [Candidatus Nanoarchaeia archaeon]
MPGLYPPRFAGKFFSYLRQHLDGFPHDPEGHINLYWAINSAINKTGLFKGDFYFAPKPNLESPEIDHLIKNGLEELIEPISKHNWAKIPEVVGYKFKISKMGAVSLLKKLNEDKDIARLAEKVAEYFTDLSVKNPVVQ